MKIFAISDLHLSHSVKKPMDIFGDKWDNHFEQISKDWQERVGQKDIVLIAGDISWAMYLQDVVSDLQAIGKLSGNKFLIRGNHDYWWSSYNKVKSICPDGVFCIQNNALKCGNIIICGTRGWQVPEDRNDKTDEKYINRELIRLNLSISEAIKLKTQEGDKIILMMHYPPFNSKFEDSVFTETIKENNIKTVVYGHLHGNKVRFKLLTTKGDTNYYLTSCDLLNFKLLELTDLI